MLLKILSAFALVQSDQISVNRLGNNVYFHLQSQDSLSNLNFLILTETLQRTYGKSLNVKALRKLLGPQKQRKIQEKNPKLQMFLRNHLDF